MRSKLSGKLFLAEELKKTRKGDDGNGYWEKFLEFDDDEYIILRSPWSRPNSHRIANNKELMKFANRPDDDPERVEFVTRKNKEGVVYCIAEWNLRDENGDLVPTPSVDAIESTWEVHSLDFQGFISALIDDYWYPEDRVQRNGSSGDDPKSSESSTDSE